MPVLVKNDQSVHKIDIRWIKKEARRVLSALDLENEELSILLTDDARIHELNLQYRDKDQATDVLSFPQDEDAVNETGDRLLGDVVLSVETADRQAHDHHLSLQEELILLLIHGILHLMGYDHETSRKDASFMKSKTQEIFGHIFPGRQPSGTSNF
ncbi:putative metalloprotease PERMA_1963 [Nitrospina gracilis 3/211]|uniref:Endoribonuclease YbeY n=1 Tax=Nitrospina gracilis (strain 3/211) TaxID=1266370 RepID=M1Z392_NITG3|nr:MULTISPECIES: rRNA maturation RNase YbeY [Nitrospina]MCF8724700.1 rRNA maturation RNase YbeY [Nitrospina sp. Nb-3]CCQ91971.1 putative metalloprotease PERMA_1963 [Nitrospina gracilis 3/211]